MSVIQRPSDAPPTELTIAAIVRADDGRQLAAALEAVAGQGYGLAATYVVGGSDEVRKIAAERGASWVPDPRDVMGKVDPETTHLWFMHEDALPRPDALRALADEATRIDAAVAGSKILKPGTPRTLESVGAATDVFAHPYAGLDDDEVDQGQHDIVRDVSFTSGASVLVRRDLLAGLGSFDRLMPPESAAMDLCWRARVAGGRVVVVPSSETVHTSACRAHHSRWRERAGQTRVMLKNYSWITLPWVVIASFAVGFATALVRTFFDRPKGLPEFVLAWGWNVAHLPSALAARRRLRRARVTGDDELFRFQVRGSIELQETAGLIAERIRARAEDRTTEAPDDVTGLSTGPPYVGALVVGALFLIASTWSILISGVPVVGFTLPVSESASATLDSWAGGWNPAGLGSAQPLHPSVAAIALVNAVFLSNSSLATTALTVGAVGLALLGTTRALRRFGAAPFARYASGAAVAAGPATIGLTSAGYWPGLLAVALAPWALAALLAPWPESWRGRLGWTATATLLIAGLAAFAPLAMVVPLLAVTGWALFGPGRWSVVVRALPPTLLASVLLNPWLTVTSLGELFGEGSFVFWTPSLVLAAVLAAAVVMTLLLGDAWSAALAATGGVLVGIGAVLARATEAGVGRELAVAGLVAAALGSGLAVAAALEAPRRMEVARLWRKVGAWIGAAAGLLVIVSALLIVPDGRAGLPEDRFGAQLAFTANRADAHGPDRVLLVGPEGTLPGESRTGPGFTYRVISAPVPPLDEAWLHDPLEGDRVLASTLERLLATDEVRPGEALAPFGIRWVVVTGPTAFDAVLSSQLDLRPLSLTEYRVFENELPSPRALADDGQAWTRVGTGYEGPARTGRRVYVTENGDSRWGSEWSPSGWANEVSAASGRAQFGEVPRIRTIALLTALYAALLVGVALWGGLRRRK